MVGTAVAAAGVAASLYSSNQQAKAAKKAASAPGTLGKTGLPVWMEEANQSTFERAKQISDQPYVPYTGNRVAPRRPNEDKAGWVANQVVGRFSDEYYDPAQKLIKDNIYKPQAINARDVNADQVRGSNVAADMVGTNRFNGNALGNYMNPYVEQALDPVAKQLKIDASKRNNEIGQKAASRGAFGGSRHGLLEAENEKNLLNSLSDLYATGREKAFDKATGLFTSDEERFLKSAGLNQDAGLKASLANQNNNLEAQRLNQGANLQAALANQTKDIDINKFNENQRLEGSRNAFDAAGALGNLGTQWNTIQDSNVDRLLRTGTAARTYDQAVLDDLYSRFKEEQDYPKEQTNFLLSALGGIPLKQQDKSKEGSSSSSSGGGNDKWAQAASTAMQWYSTFSDIRLKENITRIYQKNNINVYEYNYKGSDKKYRGVIAQEIKEICPEAVVIDMGYYKVDYQKIEFLLNKRLGEQNV
jgi:hypothetical protein